MAVTSSVPARWEPDVELGLTWACQSGGDRCASWLRRSIQVTRHRRSTWLVQWPVSLHWLQTDKQTDRQTNRATEKHTTVTWLQAGLSSSESLSCRWWRHPGMMYVAEQNTIAQSQHCQRCHRLQPITSLSIVLLHCLYHVSRPPESFSDKIQRLYVPHWAVQQF